MARRLLSYRHRLVARSRVLEESHFAEEAERPSHSPDDHLLLLEAGHLIHIGARQRSRQRDGHLRSVPLDERLRGAHPGPLGWRRHRRAAPYRTATSSSSSRRAAPRGHARLAPSDSRSLARSLEQPARPYDPCASSRSSPRIRYRACSAICPPRVARPHVPVDYLIGGKPLPDLSRFLPYEPAARMHRRWGIWRFQR